MEFLEAASTGSWKTPKTRKTNPKRLNIIMWSWFWFCQFKMSSGNQFLVLVQQENGDQNNPNFGLLIWPLAKEFVLQSDSSGPEGQQ